MYSSESPDNSNQQVAIREFAAWLIGGVVGLVVGVIIGLRVHNNIGPIIGGILGWCASGGISLRIIRKLFQSEPKHVLSVGAARTAFFGMILGAFALDFIAVKTDTSRLTGAMIGSVAGLVVGGYIGKSLTKRTDDEDAGGNSSKDGV
jgi:hypothetical protein